MIRGLNERCLPVWLQDAGYKTFYTGKLFNAHTVDNYDTFFLAGSTGPELPLDPYTYDYPDSTWQRDRDSSVSYEGQCTTDILAHTAKAFSYDAFQADQPFFFIMAPVASHSNVEVHGTSAIDRQGSFSITPPILAER